MFRFGSRDRFGFVTYHILFKANSPLIRFFRLAENLAARGESVAFAELR